MADQPVSLDEVVYGDKRPCFACGEEILEAHTARGIITLNPDQSRHALTCKYRKVWVQVKSERDGETPDEYKEPEEAEALEEFEGQQYEHQFHKAYYESINPLLLKLSEAWNVGDLSPDDYTDAVMGRVEELLEEHHEWDADYQG